MESISEQIKLQIEPFEAHILSFVFSCLFVFSIYLKNYFFESPITSKAFRVFRENNPRFDM